MPETGGEGGIRTLGSLLDYGALAKRCFRPLSHLTGLNAYGAIRRRRRQCHVDDGLPKAAGCCFHFSHWDATIVAAAPELGCKTLYSEDLSHGQNFDGLRVRGGAAPSLKSQTQVSALVFSQIPT